MESRKNNRSSLENKKGVFLLIGLLLILSVTFAAFNVKSFSKYDYNFEILVEDDLQELPPVLLPPPSEPTLPKITPPSETLDIEIVKHEVKTDEPEFVDQPPEELAIDALPPTDTETLDKTPPSYVSNMPYFGDCGKIKSNIEKSKCTLDLINSFIQDNFELPDITREIGNVGTIRLEFTVNKKGRVVNIHIVNSVDENADKEAIRVIQSLPQFVPGKNMDKPTSVLYNVPIKITLSNE